VEWHANGGYTRVRHSDGRYDLEIPTDSIPENLRKIGSEFYLVIQPILAADFNSAETLSSLLKEQCLVEEIG
jgi:hypothetical protein